MSDGGWIAFMLKDRFSTNEEKTRLSKEICASLERSEEDVWWVPTDQNGGLGYYLFVRERNADTDLDAVLSVRRECFENRQCHSRVPSSEMDEMIRQTKRVVVGSVKFGDVVKVRRGTFSNLHGIVLRTASVGRVFVGMKFCFGTVVESIEEKNLDLEGNIFNYIKVLK